MVMLVYTANISNTTELYTQNDLYGKFHYNTHTHTQILKDLIR